MAPKGKGQQKQQTAVTSSLALPPKPPRLGKAPGYEVQLVTNLFRISLKTEKPILCYSIEIEAKDEKAGDSNKKHAGPRKIPKELRLQAVENAVRGWVENNAASMKKTPCYVLDSNGSTMYALFKMLDEHDGSPGTRRSLEIQVSVSSKRFVDQEAIACQEIMLVKFLSPTLIDVKALIDHCAGKRPRGDAKVEATLRSLNIILMGRIQFAPGFLSMQAKSGSYSTFNYARQDQQFEISPGIVCKKGFISSVRHTESGLVTNIANSVVPFYEPLLLTELLKKRYRLSEQDFSRELSSTVLDKLKRELKTKQVEAIHITYASEGSHPKYRINDIGVSTLKAKFDLEDPKTGTKTQTSVFDYFKTKYPKTKLKFPHLPCIISNQRQIPLEVCRLVDKQKVNRRLTPDETSKVITQAALKPQIHFEKVRENVQTLYKFNQPLKEFGFDMDIKPIELTGRQLPQIRLLASNQVAMLTQDGQYNNARNNFVYPATVSKWALVVMGDNRFLSQPGFVNECKEFARSYCSQGMSKGVKIPVVSALRPIQVERSDSDQVLKKKLRDEFVFFNNEKFSHTIFVLPTIQDRDWIYGYLQYLEVDVPKKLKMSGSTKCTRASCIKDENFIKKIVKSSNPRSAPMFIANLWLKHNAKLGGVNHVLDGKQNFSINPKEFNNFLAKGYLFVSIDVCHPAPGDRLEQSVAAAVGMWDITSPKMSVCTRVRVQRKDKSDTEKSTVEQVGEIGVMFEEILKSYFLKNNKGLPTHIVVLRDGVSEGQFQMVLSYELSRIRGCIKDVYDKQKVKAPLLSCLTVQKRHRTRFMRKEPVTSRNGPDFNIQPGTVIDNTIVEPLHHSFYLAPHKAIQGTARAPHVYMIYDEIKFSQDSAQAMIFALSYLSPRCTKGTSIPTPVNLADLAAERGKNIVVAWNEENNQKLSLQERISKLNAFLSNMGDDNYQDTLYYV